MADEINVTIEGGPQIEITFGEVPEGLFDAMAAAAASIDALGLPAVARVRPLGQTPLSAGTIIDAVGVPAYVEDLTPYADYALTEPGWYVFARITLAAGTVDSQTSVTGAAGYIAEIGADHVDVAVKFEVAAMIVPVTVNQGGLSETFHFRAADLAIRNLDYRTTFYVYDARPFVTWQYALTTDATFAAGKHYYEMSDWQQAPAEVTAGEAVPAYYTQADGVYTQAVGAFEDGVTYYVKSGSEYTAAEVTVGEAIPAYYEHTKVTIEGMTRNITYRLDEIVDCPMEFILPEVEDGTYGCWFEIRCRHAGEYSMTLVPPADDVKIATEHTQKETAGFNTIDLHYNVIDGIKLWRFLNTHSSIPT